MHITLLPCSSVFIEVIFSVGVHVCFREKQLYLLELLSLDIVFSYHILILCSFSHHQG